MALAVESTSQGLMMREPARLCDALESSGWISCRTYPANSDRIMEPCFSACVEMYS